MKIVLIIQARIGSTRLPGKILKPILGKPMLAHEIERLKTAKKIDAIVLATTDRPEDDATAALGRDCGVAVFRGSEKDVLDRYYRAAKEAGADVVVRVTGDCALHSGAIVDEVVEHFLSADVDYSMYVPEGLDTEVFTFAALERAWHDAKLPSEREHVTLYMRNHPELFRLDSAWSGEWKPPMHWSVDTEGDFNFVIAIYEALYPSNPHFTKENVLALLRERPELLEMNKGGTGYEGLEKSLVEDEAWKFAQGLSVAIVGCGSIGARHARNLKTLGVGTLLLCDPTLERAKALAAEVGGKAYANYLEALDTKPDAVVIASPSSMHVEQALEAAQRRVAIFMEKPLATSRDGLDALVKIVEEKKIVTMMGQSFRFHEGLLAVEKILKCGEHEKVLHVDYEIGQYLPDWHPKEDYRKEYAAQKQQGGGAMFTSMSHTLDTIEWLFGSIVEIEGWKDRIGDLEIDVDDTAFISVKTAMGVSVEARNDFLARPAVHRITIACANETISIDLVANTLNGKTYPFEPNTRYVFELRYFLELLKKGEQDPSLDLSHGAHIVELMLDSHVIDKTKFD